MSELFEALIPELRARFPGRGLRIEAGPPQLAVFPAIHPEVGDLVIEDEERELTVVYGNFTHCHYGPYQFSPGATIRDVIDSLLADIGDLFANRLVMGVATTNQAAYFVLAKKLLRSGSQGIDAMFGLDLYEANELPNNRFHATG